MSRFLSDPITSKDSAQYSAPNGLVIGKVGMQGWRDTMEDVDIVQIPFDSRTPDSIAVGVFDGHGGATISAAVAKTIIGQITNTIDFQQDSTSASSLAAALCKGFMETDEALKRHPDYATTSDEIGSTGVMALITPTHIICSNVGDSRAILSNINKQKVVILSEDHKPDAEFEKQRIIDAGGTVFRGRVCGGVAVSRSFGDFWFKRNDELQPHKQLVTAEPVVKIYPRDVADEFMILCCDGVYDVMSNDQVRKFIRSKLKGGVKNPKDIVEQLVDECLSRGSRDNMTAVLVLFPAGLAVANKRK